MTAEEQARVLVREAKSERPLWLPWVDAVVDAYVGRFGPISGGCAKARFADRSPGTIRLARSPAVRNPAKTDIGNVYRLAAAAGRRDGLERRGALFKQDRGPTPPVRKLLPLSAQA
jgi:hypothetical protein